MPRSFAVALLLGAASFASCTSVESPSPLEIDIISSAYVVAGVEYKSRSELAGALKALPLPAVITLRQGSGTTSERHAEALAPISDAGINAPVTFVGNEVFSK